MKVKSNKYAEAMMEATIDIMLDFTNDDYFDFEPDDQAEDVPVFRAVLERVTETDPDALRVEWSHNFMNCAGADLTVELSRGQYDYMIDFSKRALADPDVKDVLTVEYGDMTTLEYNFMWGVEKTLKAYAKGETKYFKIMD